MLQMATVTSISPLRVRLWGATSESLVWRVASGATLAVGADVIVTTLHHGLIVLADAGPRPAPFYTGTERAWPSGHPPAGAPVVTRTWILTATVGGGGGGAQFYYPHTFAGITGIQYSPLTQNRRLTCWYWSTSQLFATVTNLSGSYATDGETIDASLTVTGWL